MIIKHPILVAALAALSVAGAAPALAQSTVPAAGLAESEDHAPTLPEPVAGMTREQVRAELLEVPLERTVVNGETDIERVLHADFRSTLSRAEVHAQTLEARREGLLERNGEDMPEDATAPDPAEAMR